MFLPASVVWDVVLGGCEEARAFSFLPVVVHMWAIALFHMVSFGSVDVVLGSVPASGPVGDGPGYGWVLGSGCLSLQVPGGYSSSLTGHGSWVLQWLVTGGGDSPTPCW
jgi:hypothetical protein